MGLSRPSVALVLTAQNKREKICQKCKKTQNKQTDPGKEKHAKDIIKYPEININKH